MVSSKMTRSPWGAVSIGPRGILKTSRTICFRIDKKEPSPILPYLKLNKHLNKINGSDILTIYVNDLGILLIK